MPAGIRPTSADIKLWNAQTLTKEFVGIQDRSRRSIKEEGYLQFDELFEYLNSVLDRVEELQTSAFTPMELNAITEVCLKRLDPVNRTELSPGQLKQKRKIIQRARESDDNKLIYAARAFYNFFAPIDRVAPLRVQVSEQLCSAFHVFYNFFAASKSGIVGKFFFCFNAGFIFFSAYGLFDAIDVAGPLMATCFYSLLIFAYISMNSRTAELAVFFCLIALAIAVATGLFRALVFVLMALVILAFLSPGGIKAWLEKIVT
jgi:hypothetical protein